MGAAFFPELVSTRTAILRCSSTCFKLTQSDCQEASKAGCAGVCRAAYLTDITCLFVAPKMTGGRALGGGHSVPVRDHPALSHYVTDDVSRAPSLTASYTPDHESGSGVRISSGAPAGLVTHVSGTSSYLSLRSETQRNQHHFDPAARPLRATGSVKGSDCRRTTESVSRAPCPRPRRPRP
jgi:hypothetical protein